MKEVKTFFRVDKGDVMEPTKVEVMCIDGKEELVRTVFSDDSKSTWRDLKDDDDDKTYYEKEDEAQKVCDEYMQKVWEAVSLLYDCNEVYGAIEKLGKEETPAGKWWDRVENSESEKFDSWQIGSMMKDLARFMMGEAMSSDCNSFRLKDVVRVENCNDKKNKRKFYRVVTSDGEKVLVYDESNIRILKAVFGLDSEREYICNGELDYLSE